MMGCKDKVEPLSVFTLLLVLPVVRLTLSVRSCIVSLEKQHQKNHTLSELLEVTALHLSRFGVN